MSNVIVKLSRTYQDFHNGGAPFDTVELREPTYKETHMSGLGWPQEFQPNGRGGAVLITHTETVAAYIDHLAVKPNSDMLSQIAAIDAMRIEKAVLDFFTEQPTPAVSPTGSSSVSASPST